MHRLRTSHKTPNARSTGSDSKSISIIDGALSSCGIVANTSRLLRIHFARWNPPFAKSAVNWFARFTALLVVETDFRQSST